MIDIVLGPKRYIQRPGALDSAADHLKPLGGKPVIVADERVTGIVRPRLERALTSAGLRPGFVRFEVECSPSEVGRVAASARALEADASWAPAAGRRSTPPGRPRGSWGCRW